MIQATTETTFKAYLSTEDNRIDNSVASTQVRHLIKLINDMDGSVSYVYHIEKINDRYTEMTFTYASKDVDLYSGTVNLLPAGHWKYEVYEVTWIGTVSVAFGEAPANESNVLSPVSDTSGVVKGIVTKGILNLTEKTGEEQVQYTEHEVAEGTNITWYGEDIEIAWSPLDEIKLQAWYKNKEGITEDGSNDVTVWADSSTNSFDMNSSSGARPSYNSTTGAVTFNRTDLIGSGSNISLSDKFTIGFRTRISQVGGLVLGTDASGNYITIKSLTQIVIKIAGSENTLTNTGLDFNDNYIVISRDDSDIVRMYVDGVLMASTFTLAGTLELGAIGESLQSSIYEIQIYHFTSASLTANVNNYLSKIIS